MATDRLNTSPIVGAKDLREAVFLSLGAASVCWDDDRVFESERAEQIGYALITYIENHYSKHPEPPAPDPGQPPLPGL